MVEEFVEKFAKLLVAYPANIKVYRNDIDEQLCEIVIFAHKSDVGKLIGKDGKMVNSIRTVISGCKAKQNIAYRLSVKPNE